MTDVADVERELEALWRATAAGAEPGHPVVRASMSNLVAVCRTRDEARVVMAELPEVLALHPARGLLLIAEDTEDADALEASVALHCHVREGSRVCGESITLTGRGAMIRRLPATARAFLLGDLPTSLWWATPAAPVLGGPLYAELAEMANQVIFDSLGWPEPVRSMVAMRRPTGERPLPMDICWRRLRGWRRILSQGLDPAFAPGALAGIGELALEHGPHALTQAWLLVGWLAAHLDWQPEGGTVAPDTAVTWRFRSPRGPVLVTVRRLAQGPAEIRSARIAPGPGHAAPPLVFESQGGGRLTVRSAGSLRTVALPAQSRAAMVARELSDLEPDPLFRRTFEVAGAMAASLSG